MPVALMSLGNTVFYSPTLETETLPYESFNRDSSFTWIPQGRIGAPIAMQYTGPGQDICVIEGRAFPSHFGGAQTIDGLRAAGAQGKPMALIRYFPIHDPTTGKQIQGVEAQVLGDFVLMRVRTGERHINSAGAPEIIEFQIELAAYGNDASITSSSASYPSQSTTTSSSNATAAAQASYGPGV